MISALLQVLSGLFAVTGKIFEWLYARKLVNAGKVEAELAALRKQVRDAQIAVAAREAQRAADVTRGSGELPDNDPFRRD